MSTLVRVFQEHQPYSPTASLMREMTCARTAGIQDELWLLEHSPVFTQGQAGKAEHILNPHKIPVVQSDRGGQVTYHGPGLLMAYLMIDLTALKMGVRDFVCALEQLIIDFLQAEYQILAHRKPKAPGVYVDGAKIASIGLRVRKGYSYHGICFNIAGDLTPFDYINPCGYAGLKMTQVRDFIPDVSINQVRLAFAEAFAKAFGGTLIHAPTQLSLEGIFDAEDQ